MIVEKFRKEVIILLGTLRRSIWANKRGGLGFVSFLQKKVHLNVQSKDFQVGSDCVYIILNFSLSSKSNHL